MRVRDHPTPGHPRRDAAGRCVHAPMTGTCLPTAAQGGNMRQERRIIRWISAQYPRGRAMPASAWVLAKESVTSFIEDEALSRGAAIAFYTVISIAPVLFIVVAIAGLAFGQDAPRGAIAEQVSGLMGRASADLLQNAIRSAANRSSGVVATVVGIVTLVVAASGVFGEMQSALNAFWKVEPRGT